MWNIRITSYQLAILCKENGNVSPLQVSGGDCSHPASAQSALLSTPDSLQDLCPESPGTCLTSALVVDSKRKGQIEITVYGARLACSMVYTVL